MEELEIIRLGSVFYRPIVPELGHYKKENTWAFSYEKLDDTTNIFKPLESDSFNTKEECEKAFNKLKTRQINNAILFLKELDEEARIEKEALEKFMQDEIIKIKQNKETADYIAEHGIYTEKGNL